MKTNRTITGWLALAALAVFNLQLSTAFAQGTAFTYQGRLNQNGAPFNGRVELEFTLWDAATNGTQLAATTPVSTTVTATNGLFVAPVDFGGAFPGTNRWLGIDLRTVIGPFTTVWPRQQVTPAPYAMFANTASNLLGALPAAQLSAGTANINITGNAVTVTHGVYDNGSYADPTWITSLAGSKITGNIGGSAANITGTLAVAQLGAGTANISISGNATTATTAATLAIPSGMALIPAGTFTMGNSIGDSDITDANPTDVTVSAFYMDVNLVSYSQWQSVYYWATNHGYGFVHAGSGKAANHPVQTVDWYDCVKWSNARSEQAGKTPVYYRDAGLTAVYRTGEVTVYANWTASGYRLPTEAEWEKAARGGLSGQRFPWGNVITENLANYYGVTASYSYDLGPNGYNAAFTNGVMPYTSPVGYFAANGYGLYDMAGNVLEWCWDWYGTPYAGGSDPRGPASGSYRVLRGGVYGSFADNARCAYRDGNVPVNAGNAVGFRCVRGL